MNLCDVAAYALYVCVTPIRGFVVGVLVLFVIRACQKLEGYE